MAVCILYVELVKQSLEVKLYLALMRLFQVKVLVLNLN